MPARSWLAPGGIPAMAFKKFPAWPTGTLTTAPRELRMITSASSRELNKRRLEGILDTFIFMCPIPNVTIT